MDPEARSPGAPGRSVGRYVLFDEIASGGMASVHLGRLVGPVGFSRTVAIKRLHSQFAKDADFVAMFLDEARIVARIRHPNVVPTLDVVQDGTELLLVMEYVQGESLSRLLRRSRALAVRAPMPVVATVMAGVLHGLHAAHEAKGESGEPLNIVHRDVSPQNIVVGPDGVPRLLDFGVAKAAQRLQSTRDGQLKGKIAYMAPEQVSSDEIDRRCDIFAAGVVLWEALAGRRLFEGQTDARVMQQVLASDIPPPSSVVRDLKPEIDAVCQRALARDPARRFQTAREMAVAIEKATPLAPASEVGEWVEGLAHEEIVARAARVADIESRSDVFLKPGLADEEVEVPANVPAKPKRPRALGLAVGGVVLVGAVVGLLAMRSARSSGAQPESDFSTASSASEPSAGARSNETTPAPIASGPSATPPASSVAAAAREEATPAASVRATASATSAAPAVPKASPPRRAAPSPGSKRPDCSQPFAVDSNGIRHVKPECL